MPPEGGMPPPFGLWALTIMWHVERLERAKASPHTRGRRLFAYKHAKTVQKILNRSLTNLKTSSRLPLFAVKNHAVRGSFPSSGSQSGLWPNARTTYPAGSATPASLCPQQRDFLRKSLKSVLRPVARYEDSQRESRAARRSLAGSGSLG